MNSNSGSETHRGNFLKMMKNYFHQDDVNITKKEIITIITIVSTNNENPMAEYVQNE